MTAPTGPHRVRRPFTAGERRLAVGETVDVTGWRNAYQLIDRGYLVASDEPTPIVTDACPRCGASGDSTCITPAGKPTSTHSGRN